MARAWASNAAGESPLAHGRPRPPVDAPTGGSGDGLVLDDRLGRFSPIADCRAPPVNVVAAVASALAQNLRWGMTLLSAGSFWVRISG